MRKELRNRSSSIYILIRIPIRIRFGYLLNPPSVTRHKLRRVSGKKRRQKIKQTTKASLLFKIKIKDKVKIKIIVKVIVKIVLLIAGKKAGVEARISSVLDGKIINF